MGTNEPENKEKKVLHARKQARTLRKTWHASATGSGEFRKN